MKYLNKIVKLAWVKDIKIRILMCTSLMIVYIAAIGQVFVPVLLKNAIDLMQKSAAVNGSYVLVLSLLFAYGIAWILFQILPAIRINLTFRVIEYLLTHILSNTMNKLIDLDFISSSNKKTGEILTIIDRFQISFSQFLDGLFVQIIPVILQIIFAIFIITKNFGFSYSLILLSVVLIYLFITISTANKAIQIRCTIPQNLDTFSQDIAVTRFVNSTNS